MCKAYKIKNMANLWNKMSVICRVCLEECSESSLMHSIYENIDAMSNKKSLSDLMMECTTVKVMEGDGLPALMCQRCVTRLDSAYTFKQDCERSDKTLRQYIVNSYPDNKKIFVPKNEMDESQNEQEDSLCLNNMVKIEMDINDAGYVEPYEDYMYQGDSDSSIVTQTAKKKVKSSKDKFEKKSLRKKILKKKLRSKKDEKLKTKLIRFICYVCCKDFKIQHELENHKTEHITQKFICEYDNCHRQFDDYMDSALHRKNSHSIKDYLKCVLCEALFHSLKLLDKHILTQHSDAKPFSCHICTELFSDAATLEEHMEGCPAIKCHLCEKIFTSKKRLNNHMKIHSKEKTHICEECGKSFCKRYELKNHINFVHKGMKAPPRKKNYLCSLCGQAFVRPRSLNAHVAKHVGVKPFACDKCEYRCVSAQLLKSHSKTHSDQLPFECSYCKKGFRFRNNFVVHERIHTGERPYSCSQCSRGFTNSKDLKVHERTHTGDKLYKCDICTNSFTTLHYLKVHRKKHEI